MQRQLVLAFVAVCASTVALPGCSSTVSGQAQTTPHATSTAALFDPCTLPPTALKAAGVDPAIDPMGQSPNNLIGWKVCNWSHGNDWGLSVYSSNHTMDQVRNASNYVDQTPVNVANRSGVLNHLSGENFQDDCAFTFGVQQGTVQVEAIIGLPDGRGTIDLCAKAKHATEVLSPYLPK